MLIFFFVNDIVILYHFIHSSQMNDFQRRFFQRYEMRSLDKIKWFLEIRIQRDCLKFQVYLSQKFYIDKLIAKFHVDLAAFRLSTISLLIRKISKNISQTSPQQIHSYQQKVEFINFAVVIIRSNIAFVVSKLTEFMTNSSIYHDELTDRVLKYLESIKNLAILYDDYYSSHFVSIFLDNSDVSFADDIFTRYSSQNYAFALFDDLINWKIFKQKTITTSSIETELLTVSQVKKKLIWWTRFFDSIDLQLKNKSTIECDNQQTIRTLTTFIFTIKLHHVNIHRHWLCQEIMKKRIELKWMTIIIILTDELIKTLSHQRHEKYVNILRLIKILNDDSII